MQLKFYQVTLPAKDNDGHDLLRNHLRFQSAVTELAGGYTRLRQSYGGWNNAAGETIEEPVIPYQIATTEETWPKIIALVGSLFADQDAIFYAELGMATIVERTTLLTDPLPV